MTFEEYFDGWVRVIETRREDAIYCISRSEQTN